MNPSPDPTRPGAPGHAAAVAALHEAVAQGREAARAQAHEIVAGAQRALAEALRAAAPAQPGASR